MTCDRPTCPGSSVCGCVSLRLFGLDVPVELAERLRHEVEQAPVGYRGWKKRAARRLLRELTT